MSLDDTVGSVAASPDLYNRWFEETSPTHDDLVEIATRSGVADVDPEPLSQMAGEGIDPVRDPLAHDTLVDLHDRLPR